MDWFKLPVIIFLAAILTSLLSRATRRLGWSELKRNRSPQTIYDLKVAFRADVHSQWRNALWHILSQAANPRNIRVCVLLECTQPSDAELGDVDPELRAQVNAVCVKKKVQPLTKQVQRLLRRFLQGDETRVAILDPRVRLEHAWDTTLMALDLQESLLSVPVPSKDYAACFPTCSKDGGRAAAKPFVSLEREVVPSVYFCPEFFMGTPVAISTLLSNTHHNVVPTVPILRADVLLQEFYESNTPEVYRAIRDGTPVSSREQIGLTAHADDLEHIVKFGTSRAGRLAVKFVT